jgi:hypothetical protein
MVKEADKTKKELTPVEQLKENFKNQLTGLQEEKRQVVDRLEQLSRMEEQLKGALFAMDQVTALNDQPPKVEAKVDAEAPKVEAKVDAEVPKVEEKKEDSNV